MPSPLTLTLGKNETPWHSVEWQKLWLATQRRPWRSLALVPGSPECSPALVMDRGANPRAHGNDPHRHADPRRRRDTEFRCRASWTSLTQLQRVVRYGDLAIIAVPTTSNNPIAVQIASRRGGRRDPLRRPEDNEIKATLSRPSKQSAGSASSGSMILQHSPSASVSSSEGSHRGCRGCHTGRPGALDSRPLTSFRIWG